MLGALRDLLLNKLDNLLECWPFQGVSVPASLHDVIPTEAGRRGGEGEGTLFVTPGSLNLLSAAQHMTTSITNLGARARMCIVRE